MDLGVCTFPTAEGLSPGRLGSRCEELGFESIWFAEHSHMPTPQVTPLPGGGEAPEFFRRTLDPFVALTAAASTTERIRLGTGVCVLPQRDPIHVAKAAATLDHVSGGRLEFGVGAGWNLEELANHGIDPPLRFEVLDESIEVVQRLWSDEVAEFSGRHFELTPSHQEPKPLQRPGPPVHIAGNARGAMRRAAARGSGWLPQPPGLGEDPAARIEEYRRLDRSLGAGSGVVSVYGIGDDPDEISRYADAGVDRVIVWLAPDRPEAMSAAIERIAERLEPRSW